MNPKLFSLDSVVSVGVFAVSGHCGPECLPNIIFILKKGCYFITTVRKKLYEQSKQEWERQIGECRCALLEEVEIPYFRDVEGLILVIQKL